MASLLEGNKRTTSLVSEGTPTGPSLSPSEQEERAALFEKQELEAEAGRLLVKKQKVNALRTKPSTIVDAPITFRSTEPVKQFMTPRSIESYAASTPTYKPKEGWGMKAFDFLFGTEAAVLGIAHDNNGFTWNVENFKQQWSEQPLWINALGVTSLVGSFLVPGALALRGTMKFGKLATSLGKYGDEATEIAGLRAGGLIDPHITKYADFGNNPDKTLKMLRQQQHARTKFITMKKRAEGVANGTLTWRSPMERGMYEFEKRFANSYYKLADMQSNGPGVREAYNRNLDKLWKSETLGTLLKGMPEEKAGPALQGYLLGKLKPTLAGKAATTFGNLTPENKIWADVLYEAQKRGQAERLQDGFITAQQFKNIGEAHFPALAKGTADLDVGAARTYLVPLAGRTTKKVEEFVQTPRPSRGLEKLFRKTTQDVTPKGSTEYVALRLSTKPRLDAPTLMHRASTHEEIFEKYAKGELITNPADLTINSYVLDSLLHTNFKFVRDLAVDPNYVASAADLASWGGSAKKAAEAGFIPLSYAGTNASEVLARMIAKKTGKPVQPLPWIRKDIFDEVFGKNGMMEQARFVGVDMMELLTSIHKTSKTAANIPTHLQNFGGNLAFLAQAGMNPLAPENIAIMSKMAHAFEQISQLNSAAVKAGVKRADLFDPTTGMLKTFDLGSITIGKKTFNLNDELLDPAVRELLEDSAFQSVEGASNINNMLTRLSKDQYMTRAVIKGYLKTKDLLQFKGKVPWFDKMTKAYLAEDVVPKSAMYMWLRGQGLSRSAAVIETGRRLPMYATVGSTVRLGRTFMFPWATFSMEAMRITKNNIMDNPLRMIPWLRAPQIVQLLAHSTGMSGGPAEVAEAKRQLPFWAQSATTVVTEGEAGATVGGGLSGALVGGAIGGIRGGPMGALVGGAMGATAAGFLANFTTDEEHEKTLRGALLDFLPHSSFMMTTNSPDFGGDIYPWQNAEGMLQQLPVKPLPILGELLSIAQGETPFGEPIGGNPVANSIAGLIGFVSPPLIQKYGFRLTTPDVPMFGDFTGITNVSRLGVDTGNLIDPRTGKPGSFSHDFFLNNFTAWKSYASSGEQQLINEAMTERNLAAVRTNLTKNLAFHLDQGNDEEIVDILSEIKGTFSNQYIHDPRLANDKWHDWLEKQKKALGRLPQLRTWSEEELVSRLRGVRVREGEERNAARDELIRTITDELRVRTKGPSK